MVKEPGHLGSVLVLYLLVIGGVASLRRWQRVKYT